MTANVAQVFLTDDWAATLRAVAAALRPHGRLVFETHDPAAKAWREWNPERSYKHVFIPGSGDVEAWVETVRPGRELVFIARHPDHRAAAYDRWVETWQVQTPRGPAEVELTLPDAEPVALLALGHGAGGGVDAPDLRAVRQAALDSGLAVARITQPYRVAGRRAPAPAGQLDEAWTVVVTALRERPDLRGVPLIAGGRSSGARVACRTAVAVGAKAVVALAFPLHPPGRPERSRAGELDGTVPMLVVNGDRDPFGVPAERPGVTVVVRPGERHGLKQDPGAVAEAVRSWLSEVLR